MIGIDEAGRGSLIGPLVVAGVSAPSIEPLVRIGVKDSKLLSRKRREELFHLILSTPGIKARAIVISPRLIDRYVKDRSSGGLNALEARAMARILDSLPGEFAVVDAASVNEGAFALEVLAMAKRRVAMISAHYADRNYAVVSAASIVAKVIRDRRVDELKRVYGDFGSGYPSDPVTRKFVKARGVSLLEANAIRSSWKTLKRLQR